MNQRQHIETMNYAADPRNCEQAKKPVLFLDDGPGKYKQVELPTKWEVCPICDGEGKHVNPSIDCGGLTADDFAEDPDFMDEYMSGTYDVACNYCCGRTTVLAVDWDALTPDQANAYNQQLDDERATRAEHQAELRMGA